MNNQLKYWKHHVQHNCSINFKKTTSIINGKWFNYLLFIFGLNMLKQKSNTYIHNYLYHLIQANLTEPSQPNHQSICWTIRLYINPWKNITYIDPLNHSFIDQPIHWTAHQSNHVLLPCAVQLHQSTNTRHYNQNFQATYPSYQSQTRAPPKKDIV